MKIQCSRCKKIITGRDEYEAEVKFDLHRCEGMRSLDNMPDDLLKKMVHDEITEDEAWEIADNRK
jgi:hypothetical protein